MRWFLKLHKQAEIFIYFTGAGLSKEVSFIVSILIRILNQSSYQIGIFKNHKALSSRRSGIAKPVQGIGRYRHTG
jgi:hypothetical protein